MKRKRRAWHNQMSNPPRRRLVAAMVVLAAFYGLGTGLAFFTHGWSVLLLLVGWVAFVRICRGCWRRGINTDDEGLIERFPFWRRRELRWDEITAVDLTDDEATLHHAGGSVHLAPPLGNWALIATMARRHLGVEADHDVELVVDLPPAQVASWLGIEPGETLTCHSRLAWYTAAVASGGGLLALAGLLSGVFMLRALGIGLLAGMSTWPITFWAIRRYGAKRPEYARVLEARASSEALSVRTDSGWRNVPWGALLRTNRSVAGWTFVSTTQGDLMVPRWLSGHRQLMRAIDEAIAARRAGLRLPRMTSDVPAAALSPAELSVDAERGLSTPGGEPC